MPDKEDKPAESTSWMAPFTAPDPEPEPEPEPAASMSMTKAELQERLADLEGALTKAELLERIHYLEAGDDVPLKGELLGPNETLRASTIAAMPGNPVVAGDKATVNVNGQIYTWTEGQEEGVPPEALAVWAQHKAANP
jgi:hypothetical protein